MDIVTRIEEIILLAVLQLGSRAYGVPIREHVQAMLGHRVSIGAIYVPLDRLVRKGLLTSFEAEPTAERGGRRKRYYKLSSEGLDALRALQDLHERLWRDVPQPLGAG